MKSKRRTTSLLSIAGAVLILLLVVGLRFWKLGAVPKSLYIDEVAMLADAKALVATGKDMTGHNWFQAIYPSYGDYKMPVYLWMVYLSSLVFGASNFAVRFPSAIAGVGTFLLVFGILQYVSKRYRKRSLTVCSALCATCLSVGISPWAIQFARTGFEAHFGQMLLGAAVFVLLYSRKRVSWLVGATILALLATYTYFSVRYVWVPVYLTWVLLEGFFSLEKFDVKSYLRNGVAYVLPMVLFGLGMLPLLKSEYYQASMELRLSTPSVLQQETYVAQANEFRQLAGNQTIDTVVAHRWYFAFQSFARNVSEQVSPIFLFVTGDQNLRHGTGVYGLFLLPLLLPAVIGVYVLARKEKKLLVLLLVWISAAAVPAAVPLEVPHALRFLNALIPFSVLIAVGLFEFWQGVSSRKWPTWAKPTVKLCYGTTLLFYIAAFSCYYFSVYPTLSAEAWEQEKTEVAVAITPYLSEENDVAIVGLHDKFFLWLLAYGPYQAETFSSFEADSFDSRTIPNVSYQFPIEQPSDKLVIIQTKLYTDQYQKKIEENNQTFSVEHTFTTSTGTEFSVGRVTNDPQEN